MLNLGIKVLFLVVSAMGLATEKSQVFPPGSLICNGTLGAAPVTHHVPPTLGKTLRLTIKNLGVDGNPSFFGTKFQAILTLSSGSEYDRVRVPVSFGLNTKCKSNEMWCGESYGLEEGIPGFLKSGLDLDYFEVRTDSHNSVVPGGVRPYIVTGYLKFAKGPLAGTESVRVFYNLSCRVLYRAQFIEE